MSCRRSRRASGAQTRDLATATAPTAMNQVWSYDCAFDRSVNGQQLKCLTLTDEFTKGGSGDRDVEDRLGRGLLL